MSDAAATPSSSGISSATMKLLIDKASQRFLFAEAGKDVVDFLFSVLATPMGVVTSLLRAEDDADALGSVVNIYASAEKMDDAYMQGSEARDALVVHDIPVGPSLRLVRSPRIATVPAYPTHGPPELPCMPGMPCYNMPRFPPPRLPPPPAAPAPAPQGAADLLPPPDAVCPGGLLPPSLYRCHACDALGSTMGSRGFVKGVATCYTIMDDLTVTHGSNMSTIALLGKIGVKDLGAIEEKTVTVGRKECLEILKVSLRSKTVLTDVFLAKTKKMARSAGDNDDEDAASE